MNSVTVLRLAGPLQAWPGPSQYRSRLSSEYPTYSMLLGLLSSMAGVTRGGDLPGYLKEIKMSVRLDRPGKLLRDFHTINPYTQDYFPWLKKSDAKTAARRIANADGSLHEHAVITERFYREDSEVLVFVDDPTGDVARAAASPQWAVFAGRKSCVLSWPLTLGPTTGDCESALASFPSTGVPSVKQAVMFSKPTNLVAKEKISLPQKPDGGSFLPMDSFVVYVSPPSVSSWTALLGGEHVA